jgi:hypothetical protein
VERIDDFLLQVQDALAQYWFLRESTVAEQTDQTVTVHLTVRPGLFVQGFLSEHSGRLSLALVSGRERVYGWDRRGGEWHLHPYDDVTRHELLEEDVSTYTLLRFMARVEEILLENELI